jgi:hypothetical protein
LTHSVHALCSDSQSQRDCHTKQLEAATSRRAQDRILLRCIPQQHSNSPRLDMI